MPCGRPKGATNKSYDFPLRLRPPANWSTHIAEIRQTRHALRSEAGPALPTDIGAITCHKVFRLLWNAELEQDILVRTNKRGTRNFTTDSLHRFVLAGLVMCVNIRTDYKKNWITNDLYESVVVKTIVSRDEFREMLHHLHPKPQSMLKIANSTFQQYWKPYCHISIDEGLICFKGRYQYRVHIRGKPDATGLKIYALADEKAYMYAFTMYQGQSQFVPDIVQQLTAQLPHSNFKIYLDAWYGSLHLAFFLIEKGFHFTMACGKNKPAEVFKNYLDIQLGKDQCRYLQSIQTEQLLAVSYNDRSKCHFLTNLWRPGNTENMKKQQIPSVVEDYRHHMGMVDRVDRSAQKATWPHRNRRWNMAFFWYLLALCVSNAHKIFVHSSGYKLSLTKFLEILISEWRESVEELRSAPLNMHHHLEITPSRARCEVCKNLDRNIAKTRLVCIRCKVHLHPRCFMEYHKPS